MSPEPSAATTASASSPNRSTARHRSVASPSPRPSPSRNPTAQSCRRPARQRPRAPGSHPCARRQVSRRAPHIPRRARSRGYAWPLSREHTLTFWGSDRRVSEGPVGELSQPKRRHRVLAEWSPLSPSAERLLYDVRANQRAERLRAGSMWQPTPCAFTTSRSSRRYCARSDLD